MHIIVIGMGQVGQHLVRMLEVENHDIVVIDNDPERLQHIEAHHDVMTLLGFGANQEVLKKARASSADLVVATTDDDEVNLIGALAAKSMGAKRVVARVQERDWSGDDANDGVEYGLLGVDVVFNPKVLLAREIVKIARSHGALEVIDLANDRIELVQIELEEQTKMLNKPLAELDLPEQILVAAIVRGDDLFVPTGKDVLLPGDRIYLMGLTQQMIEAEDLFTQRREAKRVFIMGGGVIGETLARLLEKEDADVVLVETNHDKAEQLSQHLERTTVIHGNGTDKELLIEESMDSFDLVVAASNEDEVNLMAGLLAKRLGAERVITVVNRPDYIEIQRELGIDIVLSPRHVSAEHILKFCQDTELQSLSILDHEDAEVLEVRIGESSSVIDRPLRELEIPQGALIVAIVSGDDVRIPKGDDMIRLGDTVIIFTTHTAKKSIAKLFRGRKH